MALPTTADEVWQQIERQRFGTIGMVTEAGEARTAGVMYQVRDRRIYVLTGWEAWKIRHISRNPHVSMTINVPRIPLTWIKAPPATITFQAEATVHSLGELSEEIRDALLHHLEPDERYCALRIEPRGRFLTYGIGVAPFTMRHPERARALVPVESAPAGR